MLCLFPVIVFACPGELIRQYMLAADKVGMGNGKFVFIHLDNKVYCWMCIYKVIAIINFIWCILVFFSIITVILVWLHCDLAYINNNLYFYVYYTVIHVYSLLNNSNVPFSKENWLRTPLSAHRNQSFALFNPTAMHSLIYLTLGFRKNEAVACSSIRPQKVKNYRKWIFIMVFMIFILTPL